ncbi:universal stress protein [Glaciecola sp. SC05]|uniref:universal stress protein n=1 Tax=Glaciecola sp. SC05 TaxID=1987355 RepID=UPI003527A080
MSNYKKIFVAIDIHAEYENIIQKALDIATSPDDVSLVTITLSSYYVQPYLYGMAESYIDDASIVKSATKKLKEIAKKHGINSKKVYVKCGVPADEIQTIANQHHADLIVIGTHGRSGIKLLLGSTATAVLHGVKQDVLAVRMHDK